ncbi:MAG TPA: hypothetical protein VKP00_00170, partial [Gemmatimonadaceae bacterium]|nr:hypothetical protein [Gemmatimonadaceae bacterium]
MTNSAAFRRRVTRRSVMRSAVLAGLLSGALGAQTAPTPLKYPATPRGVHVEDLAGVRVAYPYRWLESVASPEVHAWMAAEDA